MELASQLPVEEGRGAGRGEERKMCPDFMFMSFLEPGRELKFQGKHLTRVFSISLACFCLLCQACPSTLESNLVLSEVFKLSTHLDSSTSLQLICSTNIYKGYFIQSTMLG